MGKGRSFPKVNRPWYKSDDLPLASTEVKREWSCTVATPYAFGKQTYKFAVIIRNGETVNLMYIGPCIIVIVDE